MGAASPDPALGVARYAGQETLCRGPNPCSSAIELSLLLQGEGVIPVPRPVRSYGSKMAPNTASKLATTDNMMKTDFLFSPFSGFARMYTPAVIHTTQAKIQRIIFKIFKTSS